MLSRVLYSAIIIFSSVRAMESVAEEDTAIRARNVDYIDSDFRIAQRQNLVQLIHEYVRERYPEIPIRKAYTLPRHDRVVSRERDICLVKRRRFFGSAHYKLYMFTIFGDLPFGPTEELSLVQKFLIDLGVLVDLKVLYGEASEFARVKAVLEYLSLQRTARELREIKRDFERIYPPDGPWAYGHRKLMHEVLTKRLLELSAL